MRKFWALGTLAAFIVAAGSMLAAQQQPAAKPAAKKPAGAAQVGNDREGAGAYTIRVQLPAPVAAAFKQAYPNATIRGTSKETERGKTVYEVECVEHGRARDLIYAADGQVIELEEAIAPGSLPPAVTASLRRLHPKATILVAERMTRGATVRYELQVKDATTRALAFTPDGQLVAPERN